MLQILVLVTTLVSIQAAAPEFKPSANPVSDTVRQSLAQRMGGVGDLSIETAGESSRLTFPNIDGPQAIADRIIDASHRIGVKGIVDDGEETKR